MVCAKYPIAAAQHKNQIFRIVRLGDGGSFSHAKSSGLNCGALLRFAIRSLDSMILQVPHCIAVDPRGR
jgi:hypothetical protein